MSNNISKRIAELRKQNNLSQKELADKLCVSNKTISKWECGNGTPDIDILNKMSEIFKVTLDELVKDQKYFAKENTKHTSSLKKETFNKKNAIIFSLITFAVVCIITVSLLCYFFIPRNPNIQESSLFTINQEQSELYCSVDNNKEILSLSNSLELPRNNKWKLYDANGMVEISSKTVNLQVGDNIFYIVVENSAGETKTYKTTIRRKPLYVVTFNTNGGEPITQQIVMEDNFAEFIKPNREGYIFNCWDYDFSKPITSNITINASWIANNLEIIYWANNGTDNSITQNIVYDTEVNLKDKNEFTKTGYTLSSWNTKSDGTGIKYEVNYKFDNFNISQSLELFAIWSPTLYSINYYTNNGSKGENPDIYSIESETIILTNASKDGYEFVGWYSDNSYNNKVETINEGSYGDINLFAKYLPIEYSITYYLDGGTNNENIKTYTIETETINLTSPEKSGYGFIGWYLEYTFENKIEVIAKGNYGNLNLYARWEKIFETTEDGNSIKNLTTYGKTLPSIYIPDTLYGNIITSIEKNAFVFNENLKEINIPNTVTSIGEGAFRSCSNLTKITIPESVYTIGKVAFMDCVNIIEINFNAINCQDLSDGNDVFLNVGRNSTGVIANIGSFVKKIPSYLFSSRHTGIIASTGEFNPKILEINFRENSQCTTIGNFAFYNLNNISEINLPASITNIGENALCSTNLVNINVNSDNNVFSSYNGVLFTKDYSTLLFTPRAKTTYTIPSSVQIIKNDAFNKCEKLMTINFETGSNLVKIGDYAFNQCSNLSEFIIPNTVQTIGRGAFNGCIKFTTITIPQNIISLGDFAFGNCNNLKEINYNATNCSDWTSYGNGIFIGVGTNTEGVIVNIGTNVTKIPAYLFYIDQYSNSKIISIIFQRNSLCKTIGERAFNGCNNLTKIILPNSIETIGEYAFAFCRNLNSIVIPQNVEIISKGTFACCDNLNSIYFCHDKETVDLIEILESNENFVNASRYYYSLEEPLDEDNYWYFNDDGLIVVWEK